MTKEQLLELLEGVRDGSVTTDDAVLRLREAPFTDLGFAKIDNHRELRQGVPEVIYGAGKTAEQICRIVRALRASGVETVIVTRLDSEKAERLCQAEGDVDWDEASRLAIVGKVPAPDVKGTICICSGGTSDQPVAEEAARTAEALGNRVIRLYDVGVAGLERLLSHLDELMSAQVVIAVAGMEGALASVVGGLVDVPVIAVPTSIGYGASFEGLSALLSMLNSCASGVSVVNIDNGFGAGFLASRINHISKS